jgi:ribosomal protein S27AE
MTMFDYLGDHLKEWVTDVNGKRLGPQCPECGSYEVVEEYPNEYICVKCTHSFWVDE